MATHARVLWAIINWIVSMLVCIVAFFANGIMQTYVVDGLLKMFTIHPSLIDGLNSIAWIQGFVFVLILVYAGISTIYLFYVLVERNDYYPDTGVY
jgi:SNF family Na+-dependent transporter